MPDFHFPGKTGRFYPGVTKRKAAIKRRAFCLAGEHARGIYD
jgi:hypothetical protein